MKKRVDLLIVEMGYAKSRSQAQQIIKKGDVLIKGKIVKKTGEVATPEEVQVLSSQEFVGRGAEKMKGATELFSLNFKNKVVGDIGASTGGFTEFALKEGAKRIYAIDVGHGQLHESLRTLEKVVNMEGINIKDLESLKEPLDIAVVDLSYISLKQVLENIFNLTKPDGEVVALVKPQFEAGKDRVGKNGIVRDSDVRYSVLQEIYQWSLEKDFQLVDACRSPIEGKTGNREYFFYFLNTKQKHRITLDKLKEIL